MFLSRVKLLTTSRWYLDSDFIWGRDGGLRKAVHTPPLPACVPQVQYHYAKSTSFPGTNPVSPAFFLSVRWRDLVLVVLHRRIPPPLSDTWRWTGSVHGSPTPHHLHGDHPSPRQQHLLPGLRQLPLCRSLCFHFTDNLFFTSQPEWSF